MRRSSRITQRLDYKILHNSGEKSVINELFCMSEVNNITMETLLIDIDTFSDDISDYLDENPLIPDVMTMDDIDSITNKICDLRSCFRKKHKELKHICDDYNERFADAFNEKMDCIKQYINNANDLRHKLRMKDFVKEQESNRQEDKHIKFLIDDSLRILDDIQGDLLLSFKGITDDEILRRRDDLPNLSKKVNAASTKISDLLKIQEGNIDVDEVIKRYETIFQSVTKFEDILKKEVETREIGKTKLFQESKLNIKLSKFKGYDSNIDIYTFQNDFEKLYLKTTPKRLMPDLLKNNLLENPALCLVKALDSIEEIWSTLKKAYGDPNIMLAKKMRELSNVSMIWKSKDSEKISDSLCKLVNLIKELVKLCKKHEIEAKLYNGGALEKIYRLMGDSRVTRWLALVCDDSIEDDAVLWARLIKFLEKDMRVHIQKALVCRKFDNDRYKDSRQEVKSGGRTHHVEEDFKVNSDDEIQREVYNSFEKSLICSICNEEGHVATSGPSGIKLIQYFACRKFVDMTPQQRYLELRKKDFCFQCLLPGASASEGKHKEGRCQRDFSCRHESHLRYRSKKHVLVCNEHKDSEENKVLLQQYKDRCILRQKSSQLPTFSKDIKLTFHSSNKAETPITGKIKEGIIVDKGIYQLQEILVHGISYTIFYDTGCGDFVSRRSSIEKLGASATKECEGPIYLGGVGGITTQSPHGIYTVNIPMRDGGHATMTGVCLDRITGTFPKYPLTGKVQNDIFKAYQCQGKDPKTLPKLPSKVGGDVDFMIGIKYLRYHPKPIFQLPSGLTIYQSMFTNSDGGCGVIGGPHEVFTAIENQANLITNHQRTFLCNQLAIYRSGYQINPDISMLGYKESEFDLSNCSTSFASEKSNDEVYISRRIRIFQEVEDAGSQITYRCASCRSCKVCKEHDQIEEMSIREEIEQDVINKSVRIDVKSRSAIAKLPFMHDPKVKLSPNRNIALKVFQQQLRKLNKSPKDKDDVIKSERKLQNLGHVDYVKNLTGEQQQVLQNNAIQNFIPWRAVWKDNSLSTPCRLVFDASQNTPSGYSLNDLLAKGRNNMNRLQEILLRWMVHKTAFHTDIQKMYNSIKLREEDWCYQRYLWEDQLDSNNPPQEKVIKTLIYGVKSSGNQAEYGLRETAKLSQEMYPEVANIVCKDTYVDDCLSGGSSNQKAKVRADEMEIVLNKGGFTLKGITSSGENPPECLSDDQISICVAGMRWFSKDDLLSLDIGEMNFSKKLRGRKLLDADSSKVPLQLTRRHCVSKVSEVYDLTGKVMPIISAMKLDLHELVQKKLDWDDVLPDSLRQIWISNFEMIQELKNIKFKRAIVPDDAINLNINTLDFGDASKAMACSSIYARFERPGGKYSCQLVFARSKIIQDGTSQPRAELISALLNVHTGEVIKRSFGSNHKSHVKLSDSQIVLHWIRNDEKPLKQWVRNRVVEIRRFTMIVDWYHVNTSNMIADMGTRKGTSVKDVDQSSTWINGYDWMKDSIDVMPIRAVNDLILQREDVREIKKEISFHQPRVDIHNNKVMLQKDEILKRYEFSKYIIDPNKHRFEVVVRIVAFVLKFIRCLKMKIKSNAIRLKSPKVIDNITLSDVEINEGKKYFFKLAAMEVKKFCKPSFYEKFSEERDGILWYSGRILPSNQVTIAGRFTQAMKDLTCATFCVPIVEKFSPLAYSIVNELHWYGKDVKHRGIESVWREVLKVAFIIEGRNIVKCFRRSCERCKYLEKKSIAVAMGPVSDYNMTIAPPFYITQVDLAGPFLSYTHHNKRKTVKVWIAVFCCCTTSTVSLKLMEDYSSNAFLQAFIRLSCEVGYPKMLLPDEGSQLIKSCRDMLLNFTDLKSRLFIDMKVEFDVCPVGGHNMHGRVERKIREVKLSIEKGYLNERFSVIQWETVAAEVSNCINNMPLALGNITSDFEISDLITPNRLKLGRNNNRSPEGIMNISNIPSKFMKENEKVFNSWFESWLMCCVPKLMYQPKWFQTTHDLKKGDVVLFLKIDSVLKNKYQYGIVDSVKIDKDGLIRKANIQYRNSNENVNRYTYRSVRELIVIHPVDEINIVQELGLIAAMADTKLKIVAK